MSTQKRILLSNNITELTKLATAVEEFAEQSGFSTRLQFHLNLALDELVTNIINYAYNDDDTSPKIDITLEFSDNTVKVLLIDNGRAFDPTITQSPALESNVSERPIGGLGIHFAKTLMDRMQYFRSNGYNHLKLEKKVTL